MRQQEINGQLVNVKEALDHFIIKQKPSSNVEYFGYGPNSDIFIQFKNGSSYIYKNDNQLLVKEMLETESIGKFVPSLKGLEFAKHPMRLVEPVQWESAGITTGDGSATFRIPKL